MTPEEKKLLERSYELAEENNKILKKMQSHARWGTFFRVFYWLILIGLSLGSYYYIQPYIEQLLGVYSGFQENVSGIKDSATGVGGLLETLDL